MGFSEILNKQLRNARNPGQQKCRVTAETQQLFY